MEPLLSILILTYNDLSSIIRCVDNIYEHTERDKFTIFILDNGSTDGTVEYLKEIKSKYNNIHVAFQEDNYGIIKGRNMCYAFCKESGSDSQYVMFLDSDQYVLSGWLEIYLEMMNTYDVCGAESWLMRKIDHYPYKIIRDKDEPFSYVGCGGMMIKREVIQEIGVFDEIYKKYYFEDPDFCWTAHENGYKVGWNHNPVIDHQKHNLALSGDRKMHFMRNWRSFQNKWRGKNIPLFKNVLKSDNNLNSIVSDEKK